MAITNRLGDVVTQQVIRVPEYDDYTSTWNPNDGGYLCSRAGYIDEWGNGTWLYIGGNFRNATN